MAVRLRPSILFKEGKEGGLKSRINLEWPRFKISLMSQNSSHSTPLLLKIYRNKHGHEIQQVKKGK